MNSLTKFGKASHSILAKTTDQSKSIETDIKHISEMHVFTTDWRSST